MNEPAPAPAPGNGPGSEAQRRGPATSPRSPRPSPAASPGWARSGRSRARAASRGGGGAASRLSPHRQVLHLERADAVLGRERGSPPSPSTACAGRRPCARRACRDDGVVVAAAQLERHLAGDRRRDPARERVLEHHRLGVEPLALVEQPPEAAAERGVEVGRVLVVDRREQPLVGEVQQRHARRLVDAAALGVDDAVLDLVAHAEAVAAADAVGLEEQLEQRGEALAVERRPAGPARRSTVTSSGAIAHLGLPEGDAHDRARRCASPCRGARDPSPRAWRRAVRVGAVGLLDAHAVGHADAAQVLAHLLAAAERGRRTPGRATACRCVSAGLTRMP